MPPPTPPLPATDVSGLNGNNLNIIFIDKKKVMH